MSVEISPTGGTNHYGMGTAATDGQRGDIAGFQFEVGEYLEERRAGFLWFSSVTNDPVVDAGQMMLQIAAFAYRHKIDLRRAALQAIDNARAELEARQARTRAAAVD